MPVQGYELVREGRMGDTSYVLTMYHIFTDRELRSVSQPDHKMMMRMVMFAPTSQVTTMKVTMS